MTEFYSCVKTITDYVNFLALWLFRLAFAQQSKLSGER